MSNERKILIGLAGILLLAIAVVTFILIEPSRSRARRTTHTACYCFTDYDRATVAVEGSVVMSDLISRGEAFELEQGTKVSIYDRRGGIDTIFIESGLHDGDRCYIESRFVE